jgi:hypothetical protein
MLGNLDVPIKAIDISIESEIITPNAIKKPLL